MDGRIRALRASVHHHLYASVCRFHDRFQHRVAFALSEFEDFAGHRYADTLHTLSDNPVDLVFQVVEYDISVLIEWRRKYRIDASHVEVRHE